MIKIISLIFYFCILQSQAQSDYTFDTGYRSFSENSWQYILQDKTPIYAVPSNNVNPLVYLPIAALIRIEERMDELHKENGFKTNWYRIYFSVNGQENEGFVWGGNIAVAKDAANNDSSLLFLYGIAKVELIDRGDYQEESIKIQLNAVKNNVQLDQLILEAAGTIYTKSQIKSLGNKGLRNVNQVIELAFNDGYCGGVSALVVIFWSYNKLHYIQLLSNGFSEHQFSNQFFIYPVDKGGKSQIIIYRQQRGILRADGSQKTTYQSDIFHAWNGKVYYKI